MVVAEVHAALAPADDFLKPVLSTESRRNKPSSNEAVVDRLLAAVPDRPEADADADTDTAAEPETAAQKTEQVVRAALRFLRSIHAAVADWDRKNGPRAGAALRESVLIRDVYCLLDIVIVLALYPLLAPRSAIPFDRRAKTVVFPAQAALPAPNPGLFFEALTETLAVAVEHSTGIAALVRDQAMLDLVAAGASASFAPGFPRSTLAPTIKRQTFQIIDRAATSKVLPTLTSLVGPNSNPHVRAALVQKLADVPLRENGVRHIIEFVSMTYAHKNSQGRVQERGQKQGILPLPLEGLDHCAQIICRIPDGRDVEEHFGTIGRQLLELLTDETDADLARAAAFIVNAGILSKRTIGSPGSVGWAIFVEPLHRILRDGLLERQEGASKPSLQIGRALSTVEAIAQARPNAGLVHRLIDPILLSLWALHSLSEKNELGKSAWRLLKLFAQKAATPPALQRIIDNLLCQGGPDWTYSYHLGALDIQRRSPQHRPDVLSQISMVQPRADSFVSLLGEGVPDALVMHIFQSTITSWLLPTRTLGEELDPVKLILYAQLAQAIIDSKRDLLEENPTQLLTLTANLFEYQLKKLVRPSSSTLIKLSSITREDEEEAETDVIDITTSLVFTGLSGVSAKKATGKKYLEAKGKNQDLLQQLLKHPNLPPGSAPTVEKALQLLDPNRKTSTSRQAVDTLSKENTLLSEARADLTNPEPPIRAEAVAKLEQLITLSSSTIDPTSLANILLQTIATDTEEFVYLRAINAFAVLANKSSPTVTLIAATMFADSSQVISLDGRLRLAETLDRVLQRYTDERESGQPEQTSWPKITATITTHAFSVAGRRGRRTKEMDDRLAADAERRRKIAEAEAAWGGEVPESPFEGLASDGDDADNGASPALDQLDQAVVDRIVAGWSPAGPAEDVRIRASAVSLLAHAIRALPALVPAPALASAVDLALGVLALERGPEHAILRRAAAHLLDGLARAWAQVAAELNAGGPAGGGGGGGAAARRDAADALRARFLAVFERKPEIVRVLSWVGRPGRVKDGPGAAAAAAAAEAGDEDAVMRENAAAVLDNWAHLEKEALLDAAESRRAEVLASADGIQGRFRCIDIGAAAPGGDGAAERRRPAGIVELD